MLRFVGQVFLLVLMAFGLSAAAPPAAGLYMNWLSTARELEMLTSYTAAIELYERVSLLQPLDPDPLVAAGNIYVRQGNWPMAVDAFNRALARRQNSPAALKGLGAAFWGAAERGQAINVWRVALAIQPDDFDTKKRLGHALIDRGELAEGAAILRNFPTRGIPQRIVSQVELDLAVVEATTDLPQAIDRLRSMPASPSIPMEDMRLYLLDALSRASEASDPFSQAKLTGMALAQVDIWAPAAAALEKAISLQPNDAETLAFLGYVESRRGQPAYDDLVVAITTDTDNWTAHYFLGQYLIESGLPGPGAEELEQSQALSPDNPAILVTLSNANIALGDYTAAEAALEQAVSIAPANLDIRRRLVNFYADTSLRVTDNGLAAADAAVKLAPEDPELQDAQGWIYLLAGDTHRAFLHLYTAWKLDPSQASTYYHLGRLYQITGQEEAAFTAFRRADELDSEGEYRTRAQLALREIEQ